ncbi:snaclec stejaggregin-A subunit beta-1-like [Actinia tenebrosa]|uniref:Snaclec stejaggregin-A subunit beta-1-like n=1 Tax=Actinia tenebrosa TaxID=6105 RepID=A0A6P8HU82_ACTTE|nr:snaclec stejaggregin-A subunit beta-1-like [Actinia tenebrosa]
MTRTEIRIGLLMTAIGAVFCACPSGWQPYDSDCFIVVNQNKTWFEANSDCNDRHPDGHLFYMDSSSYRYKHQLYKLGKSINLTESDVYYLGAEKNASGWFWSNGNKLNALILSLINQDNIQPQENYLAVEYTTTYSNHKFKAVDGRSKYKYICGIEQKLVNISVKGMYLDLEKCC